MAITDKYVTPSGSSGNSGDSWGDPWDIVTGFDWVGANSRLNIEGGAYSIATTLVMTGSLPSNADPYAIIGYNAAHSAIAVDWDDCPVITWSSNGGIVDSGPDGGLIHGLKLVNAGTVGISLDNNNIYSLIWSDNAGGIGIEGDLGMVHYRCRSTNSGSHGFVGIGESLFYQCEAWDNTNSGFFLAAEDKMVDCYSRGNNISDSVYGGIYNTSGGTIVVAGCTIDNNNNFGINSTGTFLVLSAIANNFTNHDAASDVALKLTGNQHYQAFNNFHENDTDRSIGDETLLVGQAETTVDPSYVNIGSNNYIIGEASLIDIDLDPILSKINIGASQTRPEAGGGGGGSLVGGILVKRGAD